MNKKIIAIVLAVVLAAGGIGGGVYWKKNSGSKTVPVYPVSDENISTTYWGDDATTYGPVTTDRTQSVYLSDTQTVEKVMVEEGQTVKKGDVLMTYDTTLSEVELEKKSLEIQQMQLDLKTAQENLTKIRKYRPGKEIAEKDLVDDTALSGNDYGTDDSASDTGDDTGDEAKADTGLTLTGLTIGSGNVLGRALLDAALDLPAAGAGDDDAAATDENSKSEEAGGEGTSSGEALSDGDNTSEEEDAASDESGNTSGEEDESDKGSTSGGESSSDAGSESSGTGESADAGESSGDASEDTDDPGIEPDDTIVYPTLLEGRGTEDVPFIYDWSCNWTIDQPLLAYLSQKRTVTYAILQVNPDEISKVQRKEASDDSGSTSTAGGTDQEDSTSDSEKTKVTYPDGTWWQIMIHRTTTGYTCELISMCVDGKEVSLQPSKSESPEDESSEEESSEEESTEAETEEETEEETEPETESYDEPDPGDYSYDDDSSGGSGISYTAAEISEMLAEAQENVRDLDLDIRIAQVEYERMERELSDGSVVSTIDGVVKTVRDEDTAKSEGSALIDVSGGGGYYVTGTVSELELDSVQPGMTVSVLSWETYETYEGTVTEISEYPSSGDSYYGGSGNSNVSYYGFTVFVDESAELQEYDYVQISYTPESDGGDSFYILSSMIRTENGTSYAYVANDEGRLEKRTIRTGKSLWGSYTEIRSGLTQEDQIAFPYGSSVKEGVETVPGDINDLFSY